MILASYLLFVSRKSPYLINEINNLDLKEIGVVIITLSIILTEQEVDSIIIEILLFLIVLLINFFLFILLLISILKS